MVTRQYSRDEQKKFHLYFGIAQDYQAQQSDGL